MNLSRQSELLMSFFIENKCISHIQQTKKTNNLFINLFYEFKDAEEYIEMRKKREGREFYNLIIKEIQTTSEIVMPTTFPSDGFPAKIREHINDQMMNQLCYSISLIDRNIKIYFLVEGNISEKDIKIYNGYVDRMLMWLVIMNEYASKQCAKVLTIYLYFTSLKKTVPSSSLLVLGEYHVNTAFTMTCPKISEIVVFRKEEWFKVFLNETFHNFGLDFSDMNNSFCDTKMLSIFPVKSEVNLFESYTEFWAKIMNILFCSYLNLKNKQDIDEFLKNTEFFLSFERMYSFFQMVKVLDFMNLNYEQLYKKGSKYDAIRDTLYKENTNVLAYYIITAILMNDYQVFLEWCNSNNTSLLQFKKTTSNQEKLCEFIVKKYKTTGFLKEIQCIEKLFRTLKSNKNKNLSTKNMNFILKNLRMTICELN